MKLVHGSPKNISNEGGFKLLDYKFDDNKDDNLSPNGSDTYGPAIYTYIVKNNIKECVKNAKAYSGNGGYIHFLSIDVDESMLLNNRDKMEISEENWIEIMSKYMDDKRIKNGHLPHELSDILCGNIEEFLRGDFDSHSFMKDIEESKINDFDLDINDYDEYSDLDSWIDAIVSDYRLSDPCSNVEDNGGIERIYEYAIKYSNNLWEVIHDISNKIAYQSSGGLGFTDNLSFQKAFFDVMGDEDEYKGAIVQNGAYFVAFDTKELSIDKIVQYKRNEVSLDPDLQL
jgi:hypothetical protein